MRAQHLKCALSAALFLALGENMAVSGLSRDLYRKEVNLTSQVLTGS